MTTPTAAAAGTDPKPSLKDRLSGLFRKKKTAGEADPQTGPQIPAGGDEMLTLDHFLMHTDAIGGEDFVFGLNIPYRTLGAGRFWQRGGEAASIAKANDTTHALLADNQFFIAPAPCTLFLRAAEQAIGNLEPEILAPPGDDAQPDMVIAAFDSGAWWAADLNPEFGFITPMTERIITPEAISDEIENRQYIILAAGAGGDSFSSVFSENPDAAITAKTLDACELKTTSRELFQKRIPPANTLIQAVLVIGLLAAATAFGAIRLTAPEPVFIPPPPAPPPPMAISTAPAHLRWSSALFDQLGYFGDKQLQNITIDTGGATLAGTLPPVATLHPFLSDLATANLPIRFTATGWEIHIPASVATPAPFLLPPFQDGYVAALAAAETTGLTLNTSGPTAAEEQPGRLNAEISYVTPIPGYPNLEPLAAALENTATQFQSITIDLGGAPIPETTTIAITLTGHDRPPAP